MTAGRLLDLEPLRRLLTILDGDGEEARVVGGAVRDALLDRPVGDHDIATTATPEVVIARAKAARLRTIPTGIAHGTVTVVVEAKPFEVTTLREDVETDGRHAVVRFGRDFSHDARRRDFTINALSMGLDGVVHDYAGGLADLAAGRVRFIGDAATRIAEDYLRILRFFRFSATYADGPLDAEGLAASIAGRAGLDRLSRERVGQELRKLLVAPRAVPVVATMAEAGLLAPLLRRDPTPARFARIAAIAPEADAIARLSTLVPPESLSSLREALRLSNAEAARLGVAASVRARLPSSLPPLPRSLKALLLEYGREATGDGMRLAWVDGDAPSDDVDWREAIAGLRDMPIPVPPFSGADLIARGVLPGKALGDALATLRSAWIEADFPTDPATVAALVDQLGP